MEQWPLLVLICLLFAVRMRAEDGLAETVRQLRQEVAEMRRLRAQDERTVAAFIRRSAEADAQRRTLWALDSQVQHLKSSLEEHRQQSIDMQTVNNQLIGIKTEMDVLRRQMETSDQVAGSSRPIRSVETSSENAAKSLRWLLSSVKELRSDVDQIDRSLNFSLVAQRAERIDQRLDSIQSGLNELSHRATQETLERQKLAARLLEMQQDLDLATDRLQQLHVNVSQVNSQINSMRSGLNTSEKKDMRSAQRAPHYGHLNAKYQEVKSQLESLNDKQRRLERTFMEQERLETRLQLLDQMYSALAANMSVSLAMLDKVEAAQSTLSESIDLFQEQNEQEMREVRSSIRHMQLNVTHIGEQTNGIRQDHEELKERLTQLSADVASMENEMEADRLAVMTLQNRALNESLQRCTDDKQRHIQDAQIRSVQRHLQTLQDQFNVAMKDTGHVSGSIEGLSEESVADVSDYTSSEESSEECDGDTC